MRALPHTLSMSFKSLIKERASDLVNSVLDLTRLIYHSTLPSVVIGAVNISKQIRIMSRKIDMNDFLRAVNSLSRVKAQRYQNIGAWGNLSDQNYFTQLKCLTLSQTFIPPLIKNFLENF